MQKGPAQQKMQDVLSALQQAKQQMQSQQQQMQSQMKQLSQQKSEQQSQQESQQKSEQESQQPPQQPSESKEASKQKMPDNNKTDNSGQAKARKGQWQVSGNPGDRETLTNAAGEKFPSRYEKQLSGYYRSLAEEKTP